MAGRETEEWRVNLAVESYHFHVLDQQQRVAEFESRAKAE